MKAIEFYSQVTPEQNLSIPEDVADSLPAGQSVRVLVLVPESDTDAEWEHLAATDFGLGYADSDAIYDQLSDR